MKINSNGRYTSNIVFPPIYSPTVQMWRRLGFVLSAEPASDTKLELGVRHLARHLTIPTTHARQHSYGILKNISSG